ncbi:T9SS C-terminal target domain-containing protein [Hymenobacter oligotrophus]|uniref:T9SS C-terminal target domain-containing protein n=1 Tax=Hymenobacter oligotrophus TaxID=2319843 RepID=A0A3B7RHD9_9BACT|nr:T9SS type A sorting domain-containing protein [Hymenobacter oligotrophus]AYA38606.1 T9SS C-terminal target domain-containing protein [Hymenobacter oligotrophus]
MKIFTYILVFTALLLTQLVATATHLRLGARSRAQGPQEPVANAAPLTVYPNPVRGGQATIAFNESKPGKAYRLRISNIIGREVRSVQLRSETAVQGQLIDLSTLPGGIYFCSLLMDEQVVATKRLTLQN